MRAGSLEALYALFSLYKSESGIRTLGLKRASTISMVH